MGFHVNQESMSALNTEASLVEALDLLGLTKSASAGDLRAAYLNFAKLHHPDKRASHQAGSLCGAPRRS